MPHLVEPAPPDSLEFSEEGRKPGWTFRHTVLIASAVGGCMWVGIVAGLYRLFF